MGASCSSEFRVAVVTDVSGLRSLADAGAWQGVGSAAAQVRCLQPELITPSRPSDYRRSLQTAVDRHDSLVIGGSFLLSDAIVDAARSNPATRFALLDPLVAPPHLPNLVVLYFRRGQSAFMAGALGAMVTRTGVIAGVYGPNGSLDQENRQAFERGAHFVQADVQVLGAYQPSSAGAPYANPDWGNAQAREFIHGNADVIFGAGGSTGEGAAQAAAQTQRYCIGGDFDGQTYLPAASCLLASTESFVDNGVELLVRDVAAGGSTGGELSVGLAEHAVGLTLSTSAVITPTVRQTLAGIEAELASGQLTSSP
ncbi:MAG TPA: BMP family ABC transporter substrate-binding protein [Candidatus Dormibacteraeota bacterium]|nr:BMP family ABC transporter substrate-binding protein [Candidatus Dormibacteraeota bacterium]